jgi:hypothetical protein
MKSFAGLRILGVLSLFLTGCGSSSSTTAPAASVSTVAVTGSAPSIGATAPFAATATLSNGTTQTVSAQAAWSSSNTSVATVSSGGVVTGVGAGEADITAIYQSVSGRVHISVASAATATFTVSGTVSDGTSGGVLPNITVQTTDSGGTSKSATSSAAGAFSIAGLAPGVATLTVSAVSYQPLRTTITVAGDTRADIVLTRVNCVLALTPTSIAFSSSGGTGAVTVASQATGCAWQAKSNDAFITLTSGGSGLDAGTVAFAVSANTGAARTGTLTIAGTTVTISQDAAPVMQLAQYDSTFKTPLCNQIGSGCDSGTLLEGTGATEAHQPNTLFNSCPDGIGAGQFGIIRYIRIATVDASAVAPGKTIEITVSAAGSTAGSHRVYLAADASHPVWTQIGSGFASTGPFSFQTALPAGTVQAVRVTRSFIGSYGPGPCSTGPDDDNDDLVFRVQ